MKGFAKALVCVATVVLMVPTLVSAQDEARGWTFSQRFQGSSNVVGTVLKTNSTLGYRFNRYVEAYGGVPVYFVRDSNNKANGVGNVYSGLLMSVDNRAVNFSSDLVFTAPTGDKDRGFSTGKATVDWSNSLSHSFSIFTPFVGAGAANTISDTSFFVRPFSSKGMVGHFEGGAMLDIAPRVSIGASGYGVRAVGEQQIVSKVVEQPASSSSTSQQQASQVPQTPAQGVLQGLGLGQQRQPQNQGVFETRQETVGAAEIANDHGVSTWFSIRPGGRTDFQLGFSRSVRYQLNSVFFGMGVRVGH